MPRSQHNTHFHITSGGAVFQHSSTLQLLLLRQVQVVLSCPLHAELLVDLCAGAVDPIANDVCTCRRRARARCTRSWTQLA